MKTSEALKTIVMPRLATPEKWTKHCFAKDAKGLPVSQYSAEAVCFCLVGAGHGRQYIWKAVQSLHGKVYYSVPDFNDAPETTFEDVQKVLNKAYELALAEGQ